MTKDSFRNDMLGYMIFTDVCAERLMASTGKQTHHI
jgi:hypothetical protein